MEIRSDPFPVELSLKRRVWSQNEQQRCHWSKRHRERDAWICLLMAALTKATGACRRQRPGYRMRIDITSYRQQLITDHANLVGGCKELIDAITHIGLIDDDTDAAVALSYRQEQCPKKEERTVVRVDRA